MPAMPLPQLVDMALGTPEVGAVNFNVLHTLLHAMINKLGLGDVKAELSDFDRDFFSSISKPTKTYAPHPQSRIASATEKESNRGDDSLLDESIISDTVTEPKAGDGADGPVTTKTAPPYHQLENRVAELAKALENLNSLPTTHEFLIEVKGETPSNKRAVNNMWQSMQVKKRVETNEEGIEKLTLMMEDLMLELNGLKAENEALRNSMKDIANMDFKDILKRLSDLEKLAEALRKDLDDGLNDLRNRLDLMPSPEDFLQFVRWGDLDNALHGIREELEKMAQLETQERVLMAASSQTDSLGGNSWEPGGEGATKEPATIDRRVEAKVVQEKVMGIKEIQERVVVRDAPEKAVTIKEAPEKVVTIKDTPEKIEEELSYGSHRRHERQIQRQESRPASAVSSRRGSASPGPRNELLDILQTLGSISSQHMDLEKRVSVLEFDEKELMNKMDKGALDNLGPSEDLMNELNKLKKDIEALKNEMGMTEKDFADHVGVHQEDSGAIGRLKNMLTKLEEAIKRLTKTTDDLNVDSEHKREQIKELFNLCDNLDRKKADKEYVAMEVDVKADKRQLEGKVNLSKFDSTTAELNQAIKDILDQLANNSDEWKHLLAKLMDDLSDKLDRRELDKIKEWLESKLKALNKKIQDGSMQWSEDEAAGLRRQLIQHYHCLSCDKPLEIMPTGVQPAVPTNQGLPPSRSPRPYTTFELDQIRQHAKSFGTPEQADFYATSRQCGGSHTTTLPHQRFSRLTPTLSEEVDVMGADGHIYRGRMHKLEAKMPSQMAYSASPGRKHSAETPKNGRPASARVQQQSSARAVRPQSARFQKRGSEVSTPTQEEPLLAEEAGAGMNEMNVEVPAEVKSMHVKFAWR